ncbi:MAG: N-acetylmuramoyl-L-alanine amidase-like domain-containing protein [Myxococcota bacterium]
MPSTPAFLVWSLAGWILSSSAAAFTAPTAHDVQSAIEHARHETSTAKRLRIVSDPFVGAPYAVSPLGEGKPHSPDPDPTIRFDAFDCTTFVETTMALAIADSLDDAQVLLDHLRYRRGERDFLARRHFPEAEWLPELIALGFLTDITRSVGARDVSVATKALNPRVWAQRKRPSHLELPDDRIPKGVFSVDTWSLDNARRGQTLIPPGTLLNVVRADFSSVPVRVSHQGLVVEKGGRLFLRHAADRMYHAVVDEPLDAFFRRMQQYRRWPVVGVNLLRVERPLGWRQQLEGAKAGSNSESRYPEKTL